MRAVVQRVSSAEVQAADTREGPHERTGAIGPGLLVLVGVTHDDTSEQAERLARKLANLRLFDDADGQMNRSVTDVGAAVLVVSQFTLYGDSRKGRRPSYLAAARPESAEPLVGAVAARLRDDGLEVATGRFGAHMKVHMVGDGPVTLLLEV